MKNIDFKNPRYVLPLICLPFILLLFYVYRISFAKSLPEGTGQTQLKSEISPASAQVSSKAIEDKLEAFKQRYKKSDGYTAMSSLEMGTPSPEEIASAYNAKEKLMLDSLTQALKKASNNSSEKSTAAKQNSFVGNSASRRYSEEEESVKELLAKYNASPKTRSVNQADPMAIFRAQMAIVDSMNKAAIQAAPAKQRQNAVHGPSEPLKQNPLKVMNLDKPQSDSSTIIAQGSESGFIQAIVDEPLTGYAGFRVRIRLLSEVSLAGNILSKGTILYALISGFSSQRVLLNISSIALRGEILPVALEVYDLDGIKGLYIPGSLYREFSRELASSSVGGLSMESSAQQHQQLISLLGRVFQSTQGALNKLIRSNKAKISYPSRIFLLDKSSNQTQNSL
ncbi:conjugative transposon protein TraM [Pedobacter aquatilis]|uniref:conjugative transposon protein TraM n=1 Tax=Pedobacter aquatilis TaxID=351343 RepID=UPI0025B47EC6|nr:conjugative transposon protein TraM [Pedobacter aquatilis]MDN3586166.1 conjugative transposon protein TraM [Pedobacter aquatilis]